MFRVGGKEVERPLINTSPCPIEGNPVPLFEYSAIDVDLFILQINIEFRTTDYTTLTPSSGNKGGVTRHSTFSGKDRLGCVHPMNVLR
ncbi:hypothetical protein BMS3Bbin06_01610 [bacterium BMS3Bbin06]|nr:hypothetical protein BMS3Bbin06_01610 [bacterium BMS3Bbin06]